MASLMPGYLSGSLSPHEREELETWMAASEANRKAVASLVNENQAAGEWKQFAGYNTSRKKQVYLPPVVKARRRQALIAKVAAVALVVVGAGTGIWLNLPRQPKAPVAVTQQEILPGSSKAKLVLANGQTLSLDKQSDTAFTRGGDVQVQHHQGLLVYSDIPGMSEGVEYHQLVTPNGGEFQVMLEDGTMVWLNAASSLRFPSRFTGDSRTVQVTGEAYFEIAPDAQRPFLVEANGHTAIEVLGTRFNVNAYTDQEHIYTTLLQGAVAVTTSEGRKVLKPGQQGVTQHQEGSSIAVQKADTVRAIAWKNGEFDFNDTKLSDVMRQLSKWYDVTVTYEQGAPDIRIWGRMKRNQSLQQVISILDGMDVKVKLEQGRKLSVLR
ncbi:FecR domain-containing protein [Chitinophaga horti]|uniref:FecR domain-containing protein n=1 Tax=Chitinophaga horti TaxID=2920382 RepID=A0ABY6J6T4_9BACT|nr:FecR family protein [Chitinophaga horti]UYQ95393.1 FecR domain-containing protein [Chitinophaga horti]